MASAPVNAPGADLPAHPLVVRAIRAVNELVEQCPSPPPHAFLPAHAAAQKTVEAYRLMLKSGRRALQAEQTRPDADALRPHGDPASDQEWARFKSEYAKAKACYDEEKASTLAWAEAAAEFRRAASTLHRRVETMDDGDFKARMRAAAHDFELAADVYVQQSTDIYSMIVSKGRQWEAIVTMVDQWDADGELGYADENGV